MHDAGQTMPNGMRDSAFGRSYAVHGETVPEFRMPSGWWLLPAMFGGAAGWFMVISAVFF